jgi:hypothetical protein
MSTSHLAARPLIVRCTVIGVMAALPVMAAHAQTPATFTVPPTVFEPASRITPVATVVISDRADDAVTASLVSLDRIPWRATRTSEAFRELARSSRIELNRSLPHARQDASQDSRDRGWIERHPVLFGTLLGGGLGALVGHQTFGRMEDMPDALAMLMGAGIGAAVGALVGVEVGARQP